MTIAIRAAAIGAGLALSVAAAHTVKPAAAQVAPQPAVVKTAGPAPILNRRPIRVVVMEGRRATVMMQGEHLGRGLSMTLSSQDAIVTFGPEMLTNVGERSFEFDASWLPEGTYTVAVRVGSGLTSNTTVLVVKRQ